MEKESHRRDASTPGKRGREDPLCVALHIALQKSARFMISGYIEAYIPKCVPALIFEDYLKAGHTYAEYAVHPSLCKSFIIVCTKALYFSINLMSAMLLCAIHRETLWESDYRFAFPFWQMEFSKAERQKR